LVLWLFIFWKRGVFGNLHQNKRCRYTYPGGPEALRGIDFTVDEGDYLFICGANGSGKSTIGYLLNGLIPALFQRNFPWNR
jgi:energy-coupling factor transporter ATP-binding protein EcfA2